MINFIEQAEKLISINSVSQEGNEEIALYLQGLMKAMGLKTVMQEVSHSLEGVSKRQFNVIGILGDALVDTKTRKGLLLNTHIDTVSPGIRTHWTETGGDPFKATIKENRIYGLGSADVKLDFLCKLKAIERYRERKLKMPIYLVGTAGEEIGMLGAKFLIKSLALNPKYVIVGEPSELAVIHAHKAYVVYQVGVGYTQLERDAKGYNTRIELHCFGKSTHGSYPHLGDNAIKRMLSVVRKIKEANFQIRLTKITGGDSVNKVPDTASVEFYIPSSSFDDFKKFYRENLNQKDVNVEFGGLGESGMKFMPDNILDSIEQVQSCLDNLENDLLSAKDETFNPGKSTINFGRITCRPGGIEMHFDIRLLPSVAPDAFDARFKALVHETNTKFSNLIMKTTRNRFNPSLDMKADSELVMAAREAQKAAGIEEKLDKKATSTEAAQYFAAGFDSIVFGPGRSMGNSHTPNEHNLVDHLDKAVHFYDRMIERFCL
ncbi:MAG: M20/M25/M40 family metallo-hydrolase [Deltaproteobacteria bacterium]|nr:M20/M25/M40 family metallo-hydrolase [Deltaproteobacteria bacterium]